MASVQGRGSLEVARALNPALLTFHAWLDQDKSSILLGE